MAGAMAGSVNTEVKGSSERGGKYLTFVLDKEEYGVGILKVREIIGVMDITPVPQMPDYVSGVINLRGKVIPVVDLRRKFRMAHEELTAESCIIVVELSGGRGETLVGILVDTVSEVLDIPQADIEAAPEFAADINTDFILGIGKVKGAVKILLDIDKVLRAGELEVKQA